MRSAHADRDKYGNNNSYACAHEHAHPGGSRANCDKNTHTYAYFAWNGYTYLNTRCFTCGLSWRRRMGSGQLRR